MLGVSRRGPEKNKGALDHFGKGIVATPNDFGKIDKRPTHPELLDWLAQWVIEHDWSLKKLHALIMTSAAYQRRN